jgi:hypothetical protein
MYQGPGVDWRAKVDLLEQLIASATPRGGHLDLGAPL